MNDDDAKGLSERKECKVQEMAPNSLAGPTHHFVTVTQERGVFVGIWLNLSAIVQHGVKSTQYT